MGLGRLPAFVLSVRPFFPKDAFAALVFIACKRLMAPQGAGLIVQCIVDDPGLLAALTPIDLFA